MRAKLTPAVRDLANGVASGKEVVPVMTGVLFKGQQAVVADGYMLIIKQLPSPEMELEAVPDDGINEVIVPADALKACKGNEVKLQTIEALRTKADGQLDTGESPNRIIARLDGEDFDIEAEAILGNYPKFEQLFIPSPHLAQVAFSTNLLKKLLKSLPDESSLMLRISEPSKPTEFHCIDPDGDIPIKGLIMPLGIAWEQIKWDSPDIKSSGT